MSQLEQVDYLIRGGTVITMDAAHTVYQNGAVAVRGPEIVKVGPAQEVERLVSARVVRQADNSVILPGLVNAHTHAAMTIFRGFADDIALEPWLGRIWPLELKYANAENVVLGTKLAFAEMIAGGTTTAADMYWHFPEAAQAAEETGFRFVTGIVALDALDGETPDSLRIRTREFLERYRRNPLVTPCVQVHGTYTVSRQTLEIAREAAEAYGAQFITHASETRREVADVVQQTGMTPIEYLHDLHLLGPHTLLAHGVHLRADEMQLIADSGASVVHCPTSNLKLGSGMAPVVELREAGVNLALGTDGAASNNDLNMWEEMRLAALLQKGLHNDPRVLPAQQVLEMATLGGARALNLQDQIGSLEVGKRADLIQVSLDAAHLTPVYDPLSHLVYAANAEDVCLTMIQGQVVYQDGKLLTLDEQSIKHQVRALSRKMASESAA